MTGERHTARCLCGNITLEATGPAQYTEYCHCKWCQKSSGSAFMLWAVFDKDNVRVTSGELSYFQSSEKLKRGFCKNCGSSMSIHFDGNFDITLGVMDNPEPFRISRHIWNKSRIRQVCIIDELPRFEEGGA